MENTNTKTNFFQIDNYIAEALARVNLSEYESRALWVILRKTLGWRKEEDMISITQFEEATGVDRGNLHPALQRLASKKIIIILRVGRKCIYKFNHNSLEWINKKRVVTKQNIVATNNIVSKQNTLLSPDTTKLLLPNINTKEKENTLKQKTIDNGSAAGIPPIATTPRQPTPIQLLVASYKNLYLQKFNVKPSISTNSWGIYGRLLKNKIEQGYTLEQITDLLKIFSTSKDSDNLAFDLKVFFSDSVFNKMIALRSKKREQISSSMEEKYGKWK